MIDPVPTSVDDCRAIRVGFACVTENRLDWAHKAHNLALSIRRFGGSVADAPIVVNVVEGVDEVFPRLLEPLAVTVQAVDRFDHRFPHANKLRMFEDLGPFRECDVLVALDTDVVVVADPAPLLSRSRIRAKAEDQTVLTADHWHAVYDLLSIDPPPMDCVMTSSGQITFPWWNSGVVHVPLPLAEDLRSAWSDNVFRVAWIHEQHPGLLPATWITDQMAFALTLLERDLSFDPLPIWGNTPTCFPIQERFLSAPPGGPLFVHYHHHLTHTGFLRPSGLPVVDERIDAMNRARAADLGLPYDGLGDLEHRPSPATTVGRRLQRALKHRGWYRSESAQRIKRALVNLDPRRRL